MESTRVPTGMTIHNEQRGRGRRGAGQFLPISRTGDSACSLVHSNYLKSGKVAD